jgi:hypothetical protein
LRRQQADPGAPAFDQRVRDKGCSVDQVTDVTEFQARRCQEFIETPQRPGRGVIGRRQAFVQADFSTLPIEQDKIGECPADIESKPVTVWLIGQFVVLTKYTHETL